MIKVYDVQMNFIGDSQKFWDLVAIGKKSRCNYPTLKAFKQAMAGKTIIHKIKFYKYEE